MSVLYFFTEGRFVRSRNAVYSMGGFPSSLWNRYLKYFDKVVVVGRVKCDDDYTADAKHISSAQNVEFFDLPYFVGPSGYLKCRRALKARLKSVFTDPDASYLCRVPGTISSAAIRIMGKKNIPYYCEVVGNPRDVYSPGSVKSVLRPVLRLISPMRLKKQIHNCSGALYVTRDTLQRQYPVREGVMNVGVSDVIIPDGILAAAGRTWPGTRCFEIVSIGSLEQMYKAPDVVLEALRMLKDKGLSFRLTWLGGGCYMEEMKSLAGRLGIGDMVSFVGNVPSEEVLRVLRRSDIFVLASRTEGLPRAVVEAMSQALPCVATNVGGIPELLDADVLVPTENATALADKFVLMMTSGDFYESQSARNLAFAYEFRDSALTQKRDMFYSSILK